MKIIHLPLNVQGSEQLGQEAGFRQIFDEYVQFDYLKAEEEVGKAVANDLLLDLVFEEEPDLMWYQRQETDTITPETLKKLRKDIPWMTTWSGDARSYVPAALEAVLPYFDIFYNDTDQSEMYKGIANRYEFMPIAVDPHEAHKFDKPTPYEREIIFIGNNYNETFSNGPFRIKLMTALTQEFGDRFGIIGNGWDPLQVNAIGSCDVKDQGAYYKKAKVVISVDHIEGILHWSERLPWALASGTPIVMQRQPGIEKYFDLDFFDTIAEAIELCRAYIFQPRQHIQENVSLFMKDHTWAVRAKKIKDDHEKDRNSR